MRAASGPARPAADSAASSALTIGSSLSPVANSCGSMEGAWREARTAQARSHPSPHRHAERIDSATSSRSAVASLGSSFTDISSKILVTGRKTARGSTCPRYSRAGAAAWGSRDRSRSNAPASGLGSYQHAERTEARARAPSPRTRGSSPRTAAPRARRCPRAAGPARGSRDSRPVRAGRACAPSSAEAPAVPRATRTRFMLRSPR